MNNSSPPDCRAGCFARHSIEQNMNVSHFVDFVEDSYFV